MRPRTVIAMNLSNIEQEIIFLKASVETIDSVVNSEMLEVHGSGEDAEAHFKNGTNQRLFNIILVDFLSKSASEITGESKSYLAALLNIAQNPNFNLNNSVTGLANAVENFQQWLEVEVNAIVWLPLLDLEAELKIKRREFIKICGNIAKHNFSRLSRIVNDLRNIMRRSNISLEDEDALLILDDIYERFHTDILSYHASTLVEHMNEIRWGIHLYLKPEFERSIVHEGGNPHKYHYTYPEGVNTKFARNCYWDLMNGLLSRPYVPRFTTTSILKIRY